MSELEKLIQFASLNRSHHCHCCPQGVQVVNWYSSLKKGKTRFYVDDPTFLFMFDILSPPQKLTKYLRLYNLFLFSFSFSSFFFFITVWFGNWVIKKHCNRIDGLILIIKFDMLLYTVYIHILKKKLNKKVTFYTFNQSTSISINGYFNGIFVTLKANDQVTQGINYTI